MAVDIGAMIINLQNYPLLGLHTTTTTTDAAVPEVVTARGVAGNEIIEIPSCMPVLDDALGSSC